MVNAAEQGRHRGNAQTKARNSAKQTPGNSFHRSAPVNVPMASLETFKTTLKEIVQAKRLSASKMGKLTELALKLMENDTQLVSILYRTHKTLPTASKVSSLYAFDALSRAARSQVNKHGLTGDINSEKGNCATFLLKVEGVLDGLFHDLISTGNAGTKEKAQKILDIWVKANTFPSSILTVLADIVNGSGKEPEPISTDPRSVVQATTSTGSIPVPAPAPSILPNTDAVQSTLLALLSQATAVAPNNGQTTPNTVIPQLDTAQMALLHQLAQTAKLANEVPKPPGPPLAQPAPPPIPGTAIPQVTGALQNPTRFREDHSGPSFRDTRHDRHGSPSRNRDDYHDDHPPMGGFRGGFRGRGRGDGRPRRDDRDRYGGRSPPMRGRRSRSRSPPSRYGGRRDIKPYSPPRRPSMTSSTMKDPSHNAESISLIPEAEKDEFGRDLRPLSPSDESVPVPVDLQPRAQPPPPAISTTTTSANVAPSTPSDSMEVSPPPPITDPTPQTPTASTSTSTQPGLDNFDIATFDFTSPASWETLGNMWQVTHGQPPSQEALMQFVMSRSTAGAGMGSSIDTYTTPEQGWSAQGWAGNHSEAGFDHAWQGRGAWFPRGRGRGGGGYRYDNTHENQDKWNYGQETDAIVLGGDMSTSDDSEAMPAEIISENQPSTQAVASTVGSGGRMQRVGDRWIFVRDTPSNTA